jgi:hypothetical protein
MSSQLSSQFTTTHASKKIGTSEDLAIGIDDDGGGAGSADATAAAVGLSFDVGTSGVAGEMMGSIYRSLKALQNKVSSATFMDGMGWNLRAP